jgi:DNA-binding MarR family transcriptional regulator
MINNKSYIHIGWWMLNELHLKWSELIIYATIFSFTNGTNDHCFHWSAEYLGEWCGLKKRAVFNILKSLEKKWFIFRKERIVNWVKFVDYYTDYDSNCIGDAKNASDRCKNSTSYNRDIDSNKDIDKSISLQREGNKKKEEYKIYGEFKHIKLTDEQHEKLRREAWWWLNELIDECDRWLELNPRKKYSNYYAFIKNRYKKKQKWIQEQVEVKQKLYSSWTSKYTKQNSNINKQNHEQKFQQLLDLNKDYNGENQNQTVNRRTEIWGESLFWE